MKSNIHLYSSEIKQEGKTSSGYAFDTLKLKHTRGHRLYFTGVKNGTPMQEVIKVMKLENGKVYLSFGKEKIEIGTYEEVVA